MTRIRARLYHYKGTCAGQAHTGCPSFLASSTPLIPAHHLGNTAGWVRFRVTS